MLNPAAEEEDGGDARVGDASRARRGPAAVVPRPFVSAFDEQTSATKTTTTTTTALPVSSPLIVRAEEEDADDDDDDARAAEPTPDHHRDADDENKQPRHQTHHVPTIGFGSPVKYPHRVRGVWAPWCLWGGPSLATCTCHGPFSPVRPWGYRCVLRVNPWPPPPPTAPLPPAAGCVASVSAAAARRCPRVAAVPSSQPAADRVRRALPRSLVRTHRRRSLVRFLRVRNPG